MSRCGAPNLHDGVFCEHSHKLDQGKVSRTQLFVIPIRCAIATMHSHERFIQPCWKWFDAVQDLSGFGYEMRDAVNASAPTWRQSAYFAPNNVAFERVSSMMTNLTAEEVLEV